VACLAQELAGATAEILVSFELQELQPRGTST
jgi:hypothetical protein